MKIFWFILILAFYLISGCGDQLKTTTRDESVNITSNLLIGTWTSKCVNNTNQTTSAKTSLIFSSTGDNLTATTTNYSDLNCNIQSFIFTKILNNFILGDKTLTSQNQIIYKFTSSVFSISLEPKTSSVSSSLNFYNYCGINSWNSGTETYISGLTCDSTTYKSKNDDHIDIIQMSSEKNFIRLGNITNTDDSNGFPKTLYTEEYYK